MLKMLLLGTTWVGLEGIMLSEISLRKTNIVLSYLNVKSKKTKFEETEGKLVVARDGGLGEREMGGGSQKAQTSPYKQILEL